MVCFTKGMLCKGMLLQRYALQRVNFPNLIFFSKMYSLQYYSSQLSILPVAFSKDLEVILNSYFIPHITSNPQILLALPFII